MFADGFINNQANQALRDSIDNNKMDSSKLYQIMLRLIYRILFITVIEERNLIYPKKCNKQFREIYFKYYSLSRLRTLCEKRYVFDTHYNDLWINLKQVFKLFEDEKFGTPLDIKPLNGDLFGYNALDIINECELDNKILLTCIRNLSVFTNKNGTMQRVNYASLNVEEFGSVYEGLLEFAPQILKNGTYQFIFAKGDERSKTGSHYTPDELVKPLIKHSLEYLIEDKLTEAKRMASCEWQMVKKENYILSLINQIYKNEFLSRFGSVEKGYANSRESVPFNQAISEGGTIRNDISNEKSGNFNFGESGGRMGKTKNEGVPSIYQNSERELKGTGNSPDAGSKSELKYSESNRTNYEGTRNTGQADIESSKKSFSETEVAIWWKNLTPAIRHSLLATHHLLSLKVCDVACGSGHILLSAARRLAHEVAKARTGEDQPSPEAFREAIRDVIRNCIYGVDKNPLAVELCKVSLWLEAHNPGEPLSFLDHKIKCGDSIVGLAHREELEKGIADEAFKRMPNDDKDIASQYLKKNKDEKKSLAKGIVSIDFEKEFAESLGERAKQMLDFINMPEHTPQQITAKKKRFDELNTDKDWWRLKTLADIQTAQFFIPKTQANKDYLITEAEYRQYLSHEKPFDARKSGKALTVSQEKAFFHWFLEFPEVFQNGGFDCILGNPPFLGGKKISGTFGNDYLECLHYNFEGIGGQADLITYFFRKVYILIKNQGFISLISTNSISEGDTRKGGLERIINDKGEINYIKPSIKWPGVANLFVSLIAINKQNLKVTKIINDRVVKYINSYFEDSSNLANPFTLTQNANKMYRGVDFGGTGYIITEKEANDLVLADKRNDDVVFKLLNGDDINNNYKQETDRYIINFFDWEIEKAMTYNEPFQLIFERVKSYRDKVKREANSKYWWLYAEERPGLNRSIKKLNFCILTAFTSKYLNFSMTDSKYIFSNALNILASDNLFFISVLNSDIHNEWSRKYGSSLETRLRYTPTDCFENYPFPQHMSVDQNKYLESIGEKYHEFRKKLMLGLQLGLTKTYNQFHNPKLVSIPNDEMTDSKAIEKKYGKETANLVRHFGKGEPTISFDEAVVGIKKLRELHVEMDNAVLEAYGWTDIELKHDFYEVDYLPENDRIRYTIHPDARKETLKRLLELNHKIHEEEVAAGLWDKKKSGKGKKEDKNGMF